jgi:hypothetical protein
MVERGGVNCGKTDPDPGSYQAVYSGHYEKAPGPVGGDQGLLGST